MQLVSAVRETFGVELPMRSLFDSPTVAGLAEYIEGATPQESSALVISPADRSRSVPLSFAQKRMWFLNHLDPDSPYYNVPLAMRLTGTLNTDALEKAINEVIRRHEVLRATFETKDGEPVQVINQGVHLPLTVEDVSAEGEDRVVELAAEEGTKTFDLSRWPLLRIRLLKVGPEDFGTLFTVHHIISAGWSMGVVVREIATLYAAFVEGNPSPLPELPLQYADFAAWQQEWLSGSVLEDQLEYWGKQLSGAPTVLDLPTDKPRAAMQKFRGTSEVFRAPRALTEQLLELSRQERATLFMTLLAAFNVLLYRYTGQNDILLGTPIANRNRSEIEGLIGFFVNTLVLRARMEKDESFLSLLRQIRATTLDAYAHQDLPFEKLVQELHPERDMSRSPLFQVMLILQNAPRQAFKLPGLTLSGFETQTRTAKFDLMLTLAEGADGLVGELEYDTDLFDATTIKRMLGHFRTLLESIVAHPDQRLTDYSLMVPEEQQLLADWNATNVDYPRDLCLHELFEMQAERTPDAVALISGEERISYRELNERANRVAHHLLKLGADSESLVGVMLERSTSLIVSLLGVLKSGASYVPLDPAYPRERLRFMLEDAGAKVLLTQDSFRDELSPHDAQVVCLDTEWEDIAAENNENPKRRTSPANLAYVIYTSGSTGKPKGAAIEHHSAVTMVHWARDFFSADQLSGVLASTSVCFDLSIFEIFVPLASGGKVILAVNALELPNLEAAAEVTLINTVPSAMTELVHMGGVPDSVRVVNLAGEPLQKALVERIYELKNVDRVVNLYGPSEDTTYSTWAVIEKGDSREPTIGRPIANTQVYVLDAQQQPVPINVVGELYISGGGLARGYLDRPELTAEKFVPNPFASEPGMRMYRTGDLVRYLPDGRLEFTGRCDQQVKIRGFRIEPGEIEALLARQDGVNMTAVMVHSQVNGDKRLVAYVTAMPGRVLSTEDLRRRLKEQLPEYMVPSTFVMLDQMPLTPNGKINRRELPEPEPPAEPSNGFVAPRNSVEELLSEIWTEVLGVPRVSTNHNFFELGGHSLLATRVTSRVREMFGVELPVRSIFETPTISGMSRKILADMFGGQLPQQR
jgi:amino acid adenylation domain-containing protein